MTADDNGYLELVARSFMDLMLSRVRMVRWGRALYG